MFYSRRIGRALSEDGVNVPPGGRVEDIPQQTTILGAAKLTGRTNGGLSIGALQAFTQEEKATVVDSQGNTSVQMLEPRAHYNIIRLKQDILNNSNVGMIVTSVAKDSRYPAFTNAYDWNLKFDQNTYLLNGFLAFSHTTGENSDRISGSAGKMEYSKIAGEHWLWSLSADFTSPHYNINDAGFFFSPNDFGSVLFLNYKEDVPSNVVRNYNLGVFFHVRQNFDEVNIFRQAQFNGLLLFSNYWRMTGSAEADIGLYDQRETRGHGLYRRPRSYQTSTYLFSDERNPLVIKVGQRFGRDSMIKREWATEAGITMKPLSWMEWEIEYQYQQVRNQEAWIDTILVSGATSNIFGDRSTDQSNFILRSTITFTRELTLQLYGQVFLAKGHYTNLRQLVGTSDFVPPDHYGGDPDFNRRSLNTNVVLRWEYFPGSTLFLVWSQARIERNGDYFTSFRDDIGDTFQIAPSNVLLLKVSYWLSL
ncbi:MAG: hypothetical protein HYR76_11950 [Ignavibacteria bacterium]|nr:hypothetical protein [Ignavibacteria bacterium]